MSKKTGISFKFDEKKFMRNAEKQANKLIKKGPFSITCPKCNSKIEVVVGKNVCPHCHAEINFNF